jgi:hypothetical protein
MLNEGDMLMNGRARAEQAVLEWARPGIYSWGRIDVSPFPLSLAAIVRRVTINIRVFRPGIEPRQRRAMNVQFSLLATDGIMLAVIPMLGWFVGLFGAREFGLPFLVAVLLGLLGCLLGVLLHVAVYQPWVHGRLSRFEDVQSTGVIFTPGRQIRTEENFEEVMDLARGLIEAHSEEDRDQRWRELYDKLERRVTGH